MEYPINTPHLSRHKIVCTQEDRDEEFATHKPYTGFAYKQNLASFRKTKSWIDRPSPPEQGNQTEEATEDQCQVREVEGRSHGDHSASLEDPPVMNRPAASSNVTTTHEQSNVIADNLQVEVSPAPTPSHPTLTKVSNPGMWEVAGDHGRITLTATKTSFLPLQ